MPVHTYTVLHIGRTNDSVISKWRCRWVVVSLPLLYTGIPLLFFPMVLSLGCSPSMFTFLYKNTVFEKTQARALQDSLIIFLEGWEFVFLHTLKNILVVVRLVFFIISMCVCFDQQLTPWLSMPRGWRHGTLRSSGWWFKPWWFWFGAVYRLLAIG